MLLLAFTCLTTIVASKPLSDFSVSEVSEWLGDHGLASAFADRFQELEYDGEMLAKFLDRQRMLEEAATETFPDATHAHVQKLFSRIEAHVEAGWLCGLCCL